MLQLKPKERVEGKPAPFNSAIVSRLVCSLLFSPYFFLCFSYFLIWSHTFRRGLEFTKSRPHLPKGPEGVARQAAQKEAVDARKRKRVEEVRRKQEKEQEIARRVKAGERRSDVESEL